MSRIQVSISTDVSRYLEREADRVSTPKSRVAEAFLAEAVRLKWRVRAEPGVERFPVEEQ